MIEKYLNEEELKRIVSALVVVLGCLILGGLFASIVVPGLRNANEPETPTAVTAVVGESGWLNPAEFPPQRGGVIPPVDPKILMAPSAELVARGKSLYGNNCTACHGPEGKGDGPAAATMSPRPRNLAHPDGWTNGYHAPGIFKTLSEGVNGTSMVSFDYLTQKDRMALVQYVQSLGTFPHDTATVQSMDALAKTLATAGERTQNKIPVSMAILRLEEEDTAAPSLALDRTDESPGAKILGRILLDPIPASRFLSQSRAWRISYRELAATLVRQTPGNGFSTSSAGLSSAEWQSVYSELMKRIPSK
jgi:mono/diheme cytochrome c family protein